MQVNAIGYKNQMSFGKIYAKSKNFSDKQKEIAKLITSEFAKKEASHESYIRHYKDMGYDFILKPLENDLVSLDATNNFSLIKWLFQKDYSDKKMFNIGVYNQEAAKHVIDDLGHNNVLFKFINLNVKGLPSYFV